MTDPIRFTPRPVYWDANVFLAYLFGALGNPPVLDEIIERARAAEIVIVTSILSITEVAFIEAERRSGGLDPAIEASIDALWEDPAIELTEFTVGTAQAGRRLVRGSVVTGPRLKPMDALHLATAERLSVAEFHTYDTNLHKHSGRLGFPIHEPISPQEPDAQELRPSDG